MDPTSLFFWGALSCTCLVFLFLGLVLMLWMLSPRVEGSYTDRPQRTRADHQRRPAPSRSPQQPQRVAPPVARKAAPPAPAVPAAVKKAAAPPPPAAAPAAPTLDTSALSLALAEAQRAAEAIDDIPIVFPTISQFEAAVKSPTAPEIAVSAAPPAEPVPVVGGEKAPAGPAVAFEAGVRAAIQQAAERVEQAAPAARPVTQRVKVTAQQAPSPLSAPSLAQGMELILQDLVRREAEPLRQTLHVDSTPEGGVKIVVGDRIYFSVAEMPEGRPKRLLQQAVRQWNELWQGQSQPSGKR